MSRLQQLQKLYDLDPSDADVLYMLAQEHAKADRHAEAIAWYDRCLQADGSYCYAYFHKARSFEAMGDAAAATRTLREGLAASRERGDAKAAGEIEGYLHSLGG